MSSSAARDRSRRARTQEINNFAHIYDLSVNPMNNGYQLRVEGLVDLYPTNGRYCILQTGERGDWDTANDLRQLMLRAIPDYMPHIVMKPDFSVPGRVLEQLPVHGEVDHSPQHEADHDIAEAINDIFWNRRSPDPHFREGYKGTLWGIKTVNYPGWYHRLWHKIWRKNNGK